ncbi:M23 family metallopeptidase [Psychroserpens sp.]|uniref:M23 family metallopeptidase n=1 Tax=Psychroserpens sp. TaxID=2020870 RepID=UPI003858C7D3
MKQFLLIISLLLTFQIADAQKLKRSKLIKNDSVYLGLINPYIAPIEIRLSALDSVKSYIKVNPYGLLKEGDTLKQALVIPLNKLKDTAVIDFRNYLKFSAKFGDPNEDYDTGFEYELPFQKEKTYRVIQSFGGKFSHNKTHSKYAIDIGLPVGDTITAARRGKVYFVKEDSKEHCRTRKCVDMANKIYIIHDDGTMAHYVHLDFEGAL